MRADDKRLSVQWLTNRDIYMYAQDIYPPSEGIIIAISAARRMCDIEEALEEVR